MAIKIGNNNIIAIFKGTNTIKEAYKGTVPVFVSGTNAPTLSFVSATQGSITLRVFNNDPDTVTFTEIRYGGQTFTSALTINSQATRDFVITDLIPNTSFTFIANVDADGKGLSEDSNQEVRSTLAHVNPSFFATSSPNSSTVSFRVTNNNSIQSTIRYAVSGSNPTTSSSGVSLAPGATSGNINVGGQPANSTRTVRIAADVNNVLSGIVSTTITTMMATTANPTVIFRSRTKNQVQYDLRNNDSSTATITFGTNNPPTQQTVSLGAGATSSNNYTITGLSPRTQTTVFAQAQASGKFASGVASGGLRTGDNFTLFSPIEIARNNNTSYPGTQ
jgi:hypothetical protein